MAETAEKYLKKGSQVFIEGKIKTRSWEDQQGQKRYTTEIVADVMQLLDRPNQPTTGNGPDARMATNAPSESVQSEAVSSPTAPVEQSNLGDDLPF